MQVIPHPDFFPLIKCGLIGTEHGTISEVKEKSVMIKTASGEVKEMPADVLLFGTGFKKNLSFCPDGLREKEEEDGLWLYRNMVHPDYPNLIFVNSNTVWNELQSRKLRCLFAEHFHQHYHCQSAGSLGVRAAHRTHAEAIS